jgi:hypothetical protein
MRALDNARRTAQVIGVIVQRTIDVVPSVAAPAAPVAQLLAILLLAPQTVRMAR